MKNPLHAKLPENVKAALVKDNRFTGATTVIALRSIAAAIAAPNHRIYIQDHHGTEAADKHLLEMIKSMLSKLEFEYFTTGHSVVRYWICFGTPTNGHTKRVKHV